MGTFSCDTQIITGSARTVLSGLGGKRLLFVADPYFKDGIAQGLAEASGAVVAYFFDVEPDPSVTLAAKGAALVKDFQPDTVVALGGGSAMDCAKAMVYFSGSDASLVAIPTTSGSGSEVTDFAVLTHGQTKYPLVDSRLQPEAAILDSDLLKELPPMLIADCGFDILAHALEAYVALNAGAITDALAAEAFSVAYALLPASFAGNRQVRQKIHNASTMAGMAFSQAGLGLCHALAHALGGMFHVPHGRLNAILLPAVISLNAHTAGAKYAALARKAGLGGSADTIAVRNLKNALIHLRKQLQLPATLQQAGIDPRRIDSSMAELVSTVLKDPCCKTNPILVEDFMVRSVLDEVTGRG